MTRDADLHAQVRRGRRRFWGGLLALPVLFGAGCSSSGGSAPVAAEDEWLTTTSVAQAAVDAVDWNLLLEPQRLDPAVAWNYGENTVMANMCESLLLQEPDFSITDGLASVETSSDGLSLVFTIDERATFWNGNPVTAEDAAYSLTRNWKPTGLTYWPGYFQNVKSIEATSDRELTVRLKQPDALFEKMMSTQAGAVIEKAYSEENPDFGTPSRPPMCSGPYKFDSWTSGSNIVLVRNDSYWRGVTAKTGMVNFTFLAGDATQTKALTSDSVQGMYQPPYSALAQLDGHGQLFYGKTLMTFYLVPTSKPGPLQDARIRRALFLAVDRQAVADKVFGGAAVPSSSVLAQSAYGDIQHKVAETSGGTDEDLTAARQLVEEAGSPKVQITFVGNPGISDSLTQSLQALAAAGQSIGLNTQYKSVTLGEFYGLFAGPDGWKDVDADAFASQSGLPVADPQAQFSIWANPKDPGNYGGFSDPAVTASVSEASAETDPEVRRELLTEADAELFELLPWIPVVDVANTLYLKNGLTGPPASYTYWWYPWAQDLGGS